MSLYNDIRSNNKKKNALASKSLIKNQKLLNLAFLITFSIIILVDIFYISKENMVGVIGFTKGFIILSIILEIILLIFLIILKFNNETLIVKLTSIVIFSLPIVAYFPMLKISIFAIIMFLIRLIFMGMLIFELIKGRKYIDKKSYYIKFASLLGFSLLAFIIALAFLNNNQNRRCNYYYDNQLNGYVLDDIYDGTADVSFKKNVVKFDDNSLKNYDSKTLIIPETVKEVSDNAFKGSGIKNVHIKSKDINIYNALLNSNVENIYLDVDNANISDISQATLDSNVRFIVSKKHIDNYRAKNGDKGFLFVPLTDPGEYYVVLNNTNSKILYFNKGQDLIIPDNIENPANDKFVLNGFKYTFTQKEVDTFPIKVNDNIELTAIWSYMIIYHENGGIISDEARNQEIIDGDVVEPVTPEKFGYDFVGWYDNPKFSGNKVTEVSVVGTELYAKWKLTNPTLNVSNDINKVYDGEVSTISIDVDHDLDDYDGFNMRYDWYYVEYGYSKKLNVSTKELNLTDAQKMTYICEITINYLGDSIKVSSGQINVNIDKANYDISNLGLTNKTYQYNGEVQYPTISNLDVIGDGLLTCTIEKDDSLLINAGSSGKVTYKFNTTSTNYNNPGNIVISVVINPKTLDVNWETLDFTYNKSKQVPEGSLNGILNDDDVTLIVNDKNSINAGFYSTNISLSGENSNNYKLGSYKVDYTINKAVYNYEINEDLINKNLVYNGSKQIPNLPDLPNELIISNDTEGIKDYTISGSILYIFESVDDNYEAPSSIRISGFSVSKLNVEVNLKNNNLIYNGMAQRPQFVLIGQIEGDDIDVSYDNTFINAGEYTINDLVLEGDDSNNYNLLIDNYLKFTIKPADVLINWSNLEKVYNGEIQYPKATAFVEGSQISFEVEAQGFKDAGTNLVSAITNSNYNIVGNETVEFTIKPKGVSIVWDNDNFTFNNKKNNPIGTVEGLIGDDQVQLSYSIMNSNSEIIDSSINVGSYIITASMKANNYKLVGDNLNKNYKINKASLVDDCKYTVDNVTKTYDGNSYTPSVKGVYYTFSNTYINYKFDKEVKNYGVHEITVTFYTTDNNFEDYLIKAYVTINKRELTLSLLNDTFTYNTTVQKPEVSINNIVDGDDVDINVTNNTVDASDEAITLLYELIGDDSNNYIINNTYTYRINRMAIEIGDEYVNITDTTVIYDGKPHTISVEINNFYANPIIDTEYTKVGNNQVVNVTFESTDSNYVITNSKKGYVNILKKELTISVDETNKLYYNKKVLTPKLNISGVISGEDVDIIINNNSINAGIYALDITLIGTDKGNYNISNDVINYEIYKRPIMVEWDELLTFTFNNSIQMPEAYATVISGDVCECEVYTNIESKDAGKYLAYASLTNDNYIVANNDGIEFTITKAQLNVTYEFNNTSFIYDGNSHTPTLKSYTTIANDKSKISYQFTNSATQAGTHNITCVFSASDNYEALEVTEAITIEQKEIDVVFEQLTFEYTNENIIPNILEYNGLISGDDFSVSIDNLSELISMGSHILEISLNGKDKDNYVIKNTYTLIITEHTIVLENYEIINYVGVYDGNNHTVSVTNLPDWVEVTYGTYYKNVCTNEKVIITFTSTDDSTVIENSVATGYVTITQRELVFDVDDTLVYNGNYQTPNYTVDNVADSDLENLIITFNNKSMNSGSYTADIIINNNNYTISSSSDLTYEIIGCDVTLVWNTLIFTYSRTEIVPTAYVTYNDEILDTPVTVIPNGKCINVGTYTAMASLSDNNYSISNTNEIIKEFTIRQYELDINWSNVQLYYDGTKKAPEASVSPIVGDNCNVTIMTDNNIIPGNYRAYASLTNSNYSISGNNYYDYVINKGNLDNLPTYDSISTFTYDSLYHSPIISNNVYASDSSLIIYSCDTYKECGNYFVDITFMTENNYYEEEVVNVQLIINELELDISLSNTEFVYDGSIKKPSLSLLNVFDGDNVIVSVTNTSSVVGTYECSFMITGDDSNNYKISNTYTYQIIKGNMDLSNIVYNNTTVTYNGEPQYPTLTNLPVGLSVDLNNSVGVKYVNDEYATISFTLSDSASLNYNVPDDLNVNMTVLAKNVTIEFSNTSIPYDGTYHIPTVIINGSFDGDNIDVIYSNEDYKNNINVGTYVITASSLTNSNYTLSESVSCTYKILKGTYDMSGVTFTSVTLVYDGRTHINNISGDLPDDVTVSYYCEETIINVGSYTVTANFINNNPNYNDIEPMTSTVTITPKSVVLSWGNKSFTYDKSSHVPTCSVSSGLVSGDTCDVNVSGGKINSGTYTATASLSNNNYICDSYTVEYTISPIVLEVTSVTNSGKTGPNFTFYYDGIVYNNIDFEYDSSGVLEGDDPGQKIIDTSNIKALATFIDYENKYSPYTYSLAFGNTNYVPSITSGTVTIQKVYVYNRDSYRVEQTDTYPIIYMTINSTEVELAGLGDGTNNTYYQYYTYANYRYTKLSQAPTTNGTYYVSVLSNYEGISINDSSYMRISFTYTAPVYEYSLVFDNSNTMSNKYITLSGAGFSTTKTYTLDSTVYKNAVKFDSNGYIYLTLTEKAEVTLYCNSTKASSSLDVSGESYSENYSVPYNTDTTVTFTLEAGTYTISKGTGECRVYRLDFTIITE